SASSSRAICRHRRIRPRAARFIPAVRATSKRESRKFVAQNRPRSHRVLTRLPVISLTAKISGVALRILVVEDDKHIRRILESLLANEASLKARNPEVIAAADGEAGLKALEKGPFDLVITDLLMPRVDGFQFCRELRKHKFGANVPVIVTSAIYKDNAA